LRQARRIPRGHGWNVLVAGRTGILAAQRSAGTKHGHPVGGAAASKPNGGVIRALIGYKTNGARTEKDKVMSLLISVLITFLVVILVLYLINMLPVEARIKQIIQVIVIIIGVLSLLRALGVGF
jgi:hypothetical protein